MNANPPASTLTWVGGWQPDGTRAPAFSGDELLEAVGRVREPAHIVREGPEGRVGVAFGGKVVPDFTPSSDALPLLATLPALYPEWLGERSFCETHGVRFPYIAGEMANGIATTRMVVALAKAGLLGSFGAAGLSAPTVEQALLELGAKLGPRGAWSVNLIHSPQEPAAEERIVDLFIRRGVPRVSASAFMELTPSLVRCAAAGLRRDASGKIRRQRHIMAKISRPEVAERFMAPPPDAMLRELVSRSSLTEEEAALASRLPIAEDVTVEADSAGHTDNRPLGVLLPTILALRDALVTRYKYDRPIRVGAAGGLGTPASVASAFALGSAYVLTGSVNQSAVESGLSDAGKALLAKADIADVAMAPAADMFELGVKVQVLKRGTMFAARAGKLHDLYARHSGLSDIPAETRTRLESEVFLKPMPDAVAETLGYWRRRDPAQAERAARDPKHEMALLFRSYLGQASRWAIAGEGARLSDYQIWCGPAMGAFNRWAAGSFLENPGNRSVVQIALNLLEGAAVVTRAQQLRTYGAAVPEKAFNFRPRPLS